MVDTNTENNCVFVDVETTGLDPYAGHRLLEIAVYVVSSKYPYTKVDDGFHAVIYNPLETAYKLADGYVREMHNKTGLWDKLANGTPLKEVDINLLAYLRQHLEFGEGRATGNSVRLDLNFMEKYLPLSTAYLSYRFLDVTSVSWWAYQNFGIPYYPKNNTHNADEDINECIEELRYVTRTLEDSIR